MSSWKNESVEYRNRLCERYGVRLKESFDKALFQRNPKKFFNDNNWIVPQENFEEIVSALSELAQSDSEISMEDVELGKRGEYVQEVVQKLMATDKNFAANVNKAMNSTHVQEGKKLVTALVCLGLLLGAMGIAHAGTGSTTTNNIQAPTATVQTIDNQEQTSDLKQKQNSTGWVISMEKEGSGYKINIEPDPNFEGDPNINSLINALKGDMSLALSLKLNQIYDSAVSSMVADGMSQEDAGIQAGQYFGQLLKNSTINVILNNQNSFKGGVTPQTIKNAFIEGYTQYLSDSLLNTNVNILFRN